MPEGGMPSCGPDTLDIVRRSVSKEPQKDDWQNVAFVTGGLDRLAYRDRCLPQLLRQVGDRPFATAVGRRFISNSARQVGSAPLPAAEIYCPALPLPPFGTAWHIPEETSPACL